MALDSTQLIQLQTILSPPSKGISAENALQTVINAQMEFVMRMDANRDIFSHLMFVLDLVPKANGWMSVLAQIALKTVLCASLTLYVINVLKDTTNSLTQVSLHPKKNA